ncbi:MAG: DUF6057 family protein [Tannerellaceae bacterium]|nr:DUF6057 family protein [Tannerellaceae bacterium]
MKAKVAYQSTLFYTILFAGLFAYLQAACKWHFYFIEQNQVFQNTAAYVLESIMKFGGLADTIFGFFLQTYTIIYIGAAVTAALLTAAGALMGATLGRVLVRCVATELLAVIPIVALLLIHFDFNYLYSGTVAIILTLAATTLTFSVKNPTIRNCIHPAVMLLLAFIAGPAFALYGAMAVVFEGLAKKNLRAALVQLGITIGLGMGIIALNISPEIRFTFLPDFYYHDSLRPKSVIYFSWIAIVLVLILACFFAKRARPKSRLRRWTEFVALAAILALMFFYGTSKYRNSRAEKIKELDYYCRTQQWTKILEQSKGPLSNYLLLNYANLALANTGQLGDKMFAYRQHGPFGLISEWDKTAPVSVLHSDIFYALNLTAAAQEKAFEAYISAISGGNPRMLQRLVDTNLIYGAYPVASKYLDILENTMMYKGWAKDRRKFINNDDAVEADSQLGPRRRALPKTADLGFMKAFDAELVSLAESNPEDSVSITYAGLWNLLCKDVGSFKRLIESHAGTAGLRRLPVSFEEAIILIAENDPDYWQRFNISDRTIARFMEFKKQVVAANRSNSAYSLPQQLQTMFGDTYWYYFKFSKI